MRRFVFVPIFGRTECATPSEAWLNQSHIKAWGYLDPEDGERLITVHTDPIVPAVPIGASINLLWDELKAMQDVMDGDTTLPDAVCQAIAVMALMPDFTQLGEANS